MKIQGPIGLSRMLFPIYKHSGVNDLIYNKVTDGISHKALLKRMKSDKSVEIIGPESNYYKIVGLGRNLKKALGFKPPDFRKCKNNAEKYHLYRRQKINNAHFLARVGFYIDHEYKIMLKAAPEVEILPSALRTFLDEPENVFMPLNIWDGIISANERFEKGLDVPGFGKIFPLYGVWTPTNLNFISLFESYLQDKTFKGTVVDLGCGSGILGMMLSQRGMTAFGVDNNFQAAKSANLNAQKLNLNFTAVHGDAESITIPTCNIIVCNPPWIPGKASSGLDRGNYDEDEKLLKACFMQTKKLETDGKLLLVYSDLAHNLGLQTKDRIEELCMKHELVIKNVYEKEFPISLDYNDPFKKVKDESKIFLYEIFKL